MPNTSISNTSLEEIAQHLKSWDDFVICGHVSPDGDCLGSQLLLYHALCRLGKKAICLLARDEVPDKGLAFLPGLDVMIPASSFSGRCEVCICVDVPTRDRLGSAAAAIHDAASFTVTIDHHSADVAFSDFTYVDTKASAAGLLVWELIGYLLGTEDPSPEMSTCAYTALMTDTGRFQFQNTDMRTFLAAAEMTKLGAKPDAIAQSVYQSRSYASLKLEELALSRLMYVANKRAVVSWLSVKDFSKVGALKSDAEPIVDVLRSLEGISVVCLLRQNNFQIRGSFRAKDDTDVSQLAAFFGGGGHAAAAGFTIDDTTLPYSIDKVIELLEIKLCQIHEAN